MLRDGTDNLPGIISIKRERSSLQIRRFRVPEEDSLLDLKQMKWKFLPKDERPSVRFDLKDLPSEESSDPLSPSNSSSEMKTSEKTSNEFPLF